MNKSVPFVGSEFAFEDFTGLELNKYEYRYLKEEACGDMTCDVVERKPLYEHAGYSRQIASYCQKLCMGLPCGGAILAFSIHEFDASNDLGELI